MVDNEQNIGFKLQYLAREYPENPEKMRQKCHDAFMKNREETDPRNIKRLIYKGEYVCKELEALYSLKKYRAMKKRYYDDS